MAAECTDGGPEEVGGIPGLMYMYVVCTFTCRPSHHVPKLGGNADLGLIYVAVDSLGNVCLHLSSSGECTL